MRCAVALLKISSFPSIRLSLKLISELEKSPKQSQRALSNHCGVSLGSINNCLTTLIKKGYVKTYNFRNNKNKLVYAYVLTPSGIKIKKDLMLAFLESKKVEYDALHEEIKSLEDDLKT